MTTDTPTEFELGGTDAYRRGGRRENRSRGGRETTEAGGEEAGVGGVETPQSQIEKTVAEKTKRGVKVKREWRRPVHQLSVILDARRGI